MTMMTDPRKRHEIIATLSSLWAKYPEMRFCQLIQFITNSTDSFYLEDGEFFRQATQRLHGAINDELKSGYNPDFKAAIEEVRRYEVH